MAMDFELLHTTTSRTGVLQRWELINLVLECMHEKLANDARKLHIEVFRILERQIKIHLDRNPAHFELGFFDCPVLSM